MGGCVLQDSGSQEGEEEIMPLGRPEIWVRAHTLR